MVDEKQAITSTTTLALWAGFACTVRAIFQQLLNRIANPRLLTDDSKLWRLLGCHIDETVKPNKLVGRTGARNDA